MTNLVRRWHMFVDTYSIGSKEVHEVEPAEMEDGEWVKYDDIKHLLQVEPKARMEMTGPITWSCTVCGTKDTASPCEHVRLL